MNDLSLLATLAGSSLRLVEGHLDGIDDEGRVLFRGANETAVPVVIGVELSDGALVKAARTNRRALVVFPEAPGGRPVLLALLRERVSSVARDASPGELEVRMDGETLRLSAEKTIELRCGKARLQLRQDGRVVLKGAHIVSAATGPHRIKGATIALN